MPQMSPLNWMFLYIYFLLILMVINIVLNYLYVINNLNESKIKFFKKNNYKWMW